MNFIEKTKLEITTLLKFFNLLDAESRLSITNLAVILVLIKLAVMPAGATSLTELGAAMLAFLNYGHKRMVTNANNTPSEEPAEDTVTPQIEAINSKIEAMSSTVSTLSLQAGFKKMGGQ